MKKTKTKYEPFIVLTPLNAMSIVWDNVIPYQEKELFYPVWDIQLLYSYNGFLTEC